MTDLAETTRTESAVRPFHIDVPEEELAELRPAVAGRATPAVRVRRDWATSVAQSHTPWDPPPLGSRFTLDTENVIAEVVRTGRVARADDWKER
jgi:hypothetical protein